MLPHEILNNTSIESAKIKELVHGEISLLGIRKRIDEDERRDPVGAYNDAVTLHRTLECLNLILADPALRYLLGQRLREDLCSPNIHQRTYEAQVLVAFNLARMSEISKSFEEDTHSSSNQTHG